jgi:hypothetical protein
LHDAGADPRDVLRLFEGVRRTPATESLARAALKKESRVYYFDERGDSHDISSLNPGASEPEEAGWGGLTEFSGRVADVVAEVIAGRGVRG